jgi:methionyl-tRNA synthetase
MYVWVDALANYLTGAGYPDFIGRPRWPADVHIIGKDIVRFHTVYWPAFLMSAGLPLPKRVFGHGFLLNRGEKMSKSVGNVVDPLEMAKAYGVDQLRYFLLREVSYGQDGSYSHEAIVNRANAELANSFGNLAQRVLSMIFKNLGGALPEAGQAAEDIDLIVRVSEACTVELAREFDQFAFSVGIEAWLRAVFACNQYVDTQAPWALRKTNPQRMEAVLGTLFVCIRDLAIAISPVVPTSAAKLLDLMGIAAEERDLAALLDRGWYDRLRGSGFKLGAPVPIFPRLEFAEEAA